MRTCGGQAERNIGEEHRLWNSERAGVDSLLLLAICRMWGELFYLSKPHFQDKDNHAPLPSILIH